MDPPRISLNVRSAGNYFLRADIREGKGGMSAKLSSASFLSCCRFFQSDPFLTPRAFDLQMFVNRTVSRFDVFFDGLAPTRSRIEVLIPAQSKTVRLNSVAPIARVIALNSVSAHDRGNHATQHAAQSQKQKNQKYGDRWQRNGHKKIRKKYLKKKFTYRY